MRAARSACPCCNHAPALLVSYRRRRAPRAWCPRCGREFYDDTPAEQLTIADAIRRSADAAPPCDPIIALEGDDRGVT